MQQLLYKSAPDANSTSSHTTAMDDKFENFLSLLVSRYLQTDVHSWTRPVEFFSRYACDPPGGCV